MANTLTQNLTELTTATDGDVLHIVDDPTGTPADKHITLANLRSSMYPNAMVILPSGDTSGATDSAALQDALDTANSGSIKTVLLTGAYYINDTLTLATLVRLVGLDNASVYYVGPTDAGDSARYAISVSGARASVQNIRLYCSFKCRGIKCYQVYYGYEPILRNVMVYESRQIATELIDCWYGNVQDLTLLAFHGVAIHTERCNSVTYQNVRLQTGALHWHTSGATTENFSHANNIALWAYANTHTNAQTATQYGTDYKTDWPATTDVAEADRAAIVIETVQFQTIFRNLCMELVATGDLPLINAKHSTSSFDGIYVEGGWHNATGCLVAIDGDGWKKGTNLAFRNAYVLTDSTNGKVGYFATLTNSTKNIVVDNFHSGAGHVVLGVVNTVGGSHTGTSVVNALGTSDGDGLVPLTEIV